MKSSIRQLFPINCLRKDTIVITNFIDNKRKWEVVSCDDLRRSSLFWTKVLFTTRCSKLMCRINYSCYDSNSGDIVSNTITYQKAIKKRERRTSLIRVLRWLTNYQAGRSWRSCNAVRSYWSLMHTLFYIRDIAASAYYRFYRNESGSFNPGILFNVCTTCST